MKRERSSSWYWKKSIVCFVYNEKRFVVGLVILMAKLDCCYRWRSYGAPLLSMLSKVIDSRKNYRNPLCILNHCLSKISETALF